jgi:hypothetical protein
VSECPDLSVTICVGTATLGCPSSFAGEGARATRFVILIRNAPHA